MISPRQRRIVAVILGVVLAGVPVIGFQYWLRGLIERQGQAEVDVSAKRALSLAEARIGRVVRSLDQLADAGVNSCSGDNLDILHQTAFATSPLKELSIVGPDGQTFCTDLGIPLGPWTVLNPQTGRPGDILIEVLRFQHRRGNVVRVRRIGRDGMGIAATIPADVLTLQVASQGGPFTGYARLAASDGTLIGEGGSPPPADTPKNELFAASDQSNRYGLIASVTMPRAAVIASNNDIRKIGAVVTSVLSMALFLLALLLSRRQQGNPIAELRHALKTGEFTPYYQPIVDITSARLLGAEVLVRWSKPDGTIVSPGAFVPLMEQSGLIVELTRNLMRRACEELGDVYQRRPHLKLSFNLTAQHFTDESVVEEIKDIFGRAKIQLSQVVLELTERQPLENFTTTRQVIAALQELGCQVALDDVGTGHSGLTSILKLGVDVIKVDKIFVDSISTERNSAAIVETLVDLARNMRMDIIAEGVENFDQVADLRDRGVRAAQGYVFAPPLPGPLFLQLLEASDPLPASQGDFVDPSPGRTAAA